MKMTYYKLTIGGVAPRLTKNQKCRIECPDGTNLRSIYLGEARSDDKPVFSIECETDVMISGAMLYNFAERHRILFGERVILPNEQSSQSISENTGFSGVSGIPGSFDPKKPLKFQAATMYGTSNNKEFQFESRHNIVKDFALKLWITLKTQYALISVITIVAWALGYAISESHAGLYMGFLLALAVAKYKSKIIELITNKRK